MIETLYSLKIVLILLLGILVVDELFLSIHTAETANFFSVRAALVHQDTTKVDDFFNRYIFRTIIFNGKNKFFRFSNLKTTEDEAHILTTTLKVESPIGWHVPVEISTSVKGIPE